VTARSSWPGDSAGDIVLARYSPMDIRLPRWRRRPGATRPRLDETASDLVVAPDGRLIGPSRISATAGHPVCQSPSPFSSAGALIGPSRPTPNVQADVHRANTGASTMSTGRVAGQDDRAVTENHHATRDLARFSEISGGPTVAPECAVA